MIAEATIERLRANARESQALIEAGPLPCPTCDRVHPATFVFKGRRREWHALLDGQMSPARIAAREAQRSRR